MLTIIATSAGCGTSSSHNHAAPPSLVPAAYATDRQPGYAFTLNFSVDGSGQHAAFS